MLSASSSLRHSPWRQSKDGQRVRSPAQSQLEEDQHLQRSRKAWSSPQGPDTAHCRTRRWQKWKCHCGMLHPQGQPRLVPGGASREPSHCSGSVLQRFGCESSHPRVGPPLPAFLRARPLWPLVRTTATASGHGDAKVDVGMGHLPVITVGGSGNQPGESHPIIAAARHQHP